MLLPPLPFPCSKEQQRALQQEAWNMANDSLRTPLCVTYRAEAVACGIIFTAARKLKVRSSTSAASWSAAPAVLGCIRPWHLLCTQ